jgi:all-trans-retinol 13,14-reductase
MDRYRHFDPSQRFDVLVIGAGLGGLTAAGILSEQGAKVLVVDQHTVAGGNATVFHRTGYTFEIGVHYVGDGGPNGVIRRVLRMAGADHEFLPMDPEGFDTVCLPDGTRFSYPRGVDAFEARLLEAFPREAQGVRQWCRFLRETWNLMQANFRPLKVLAALPFSRFAARHLNSTLDEVLDACTHDARLRTVLIGPHLDHGVAPGKVSALLHAGLVMTYLVDGGWYPKGGGQALSDTLVARVERAGGQVLLLATAERIVVEQGRAAGVVFHNKHVGRHEVRADAVISNADLKQTWARLLPPEVVPPEQRQKVERYEMAGALAVLYLGVKREALGAHGARNTNWWVFPSTDVAGDYRAAAEGRFSDAPSALIAITSNKDPSQRIAPDGIANLQVMALAPGTRAAWGAPEGDYRRAPAYLEAKQRFRDTMVRQAARVFPELPSGIVFEEVATPVTHARYTLSSNGTAFGIASTPAQFGRARPGARTSLPGLFLAGASLRSTHGVYGAVLSGRSAARAVARALAEKKR